MERNVKVKIAVNRNGKRNRNNTSIFTERRKQGWEGGDAEGNGNGSRELITILQVYKEEINGMGVSGVRDG